MNMDDIRVSIIKPKEVNLTVVENRHRFMQLEHIPSGIIVTKYNKVQHLAKKEAIGEMEELIKLWETI